MVFCLTLLRDVVRVAPDKFDRQLIDVLKEELDKKYSNKVIADVGLCIVTQDLKQVQDAVIYPADGGAHHRVVFRMLVYRPLVGEIAVGTIVVSNAEGIRVSLDFFDDIFIPNYLLPQPSEYDPRTRLWVWRYEGADNGEAGVFNMHEQVRFRVESVAYRPRAADRTATAAAATSASPVRAPPPISVTCPSLNRVGPHASAPLGSLSSGDGSISSSSSSSSSKRGGGGGAAGGTEGGASGALISASGAGVMTVTASCNDMGLGLTAWRWGD